MGKEKGRIKGDRKQTKRPYTTPKLVVHGTLEEITKSPKGVGTRDGHLTKS